MLETKIDALTAAVVALTGQMASLLQQGQAPTQPATVVTQAAPAAVSFGGAAPLPNGMPGGPFPGAGAPPVAAAFTPPAVGGAPFGDLGGCTKYATDSYHALEAKAVGRGEVVTQLIHHLCGSNSINDLPVTSYAAFYTELEKQKAL